MPKTYEQELLEVESARISADLAYHRERDVLKHKALFSKAQIDAIRNERPWYMLGGILIGLVVGIFLSWVYCHQQ
jgi:hypothetical protein